MGRPRDAIGLLAAGLRLRWQVDLSGVGRRRGRRLSSGAVHLPAAISLRAYGGWGAAPETRSDLDDQALCNRARQEGFAIVLRSKAWSIAAGIERSHILERWGRTNAQRLRGS